MSDADVVTKDSVDDRILMHILLSTTQSLIIGDTFDEFLQERRLVSRFPHGDIERGLDRLRHGGLVAFQRTNFGAKEYRLTDAGHVAATQLGVDHPCPPDENGRWLLWSPVHD